MQIKFKLQADLSTYVCNLFSAFSFSGPKNNKDLQGGKVFFYICLQNLAQCGPNPFIALEG